ncbi:MAG: peptidoglycan bridge formation glycyltransferase FemA/FemB family protein [Chloroflexota bacterium]|nr:peptidoglycan bridge formation glycyltransferase FemA/FemB family protein [Chloroflexota bacterium]
MSEGPVTLAVQRPNPEDWDQFVRSQARAHLLQLAAWGRLKSQFGWGAQIVALSDGGEIVAGASVLLKDLPLGLGRMAYLPRGPYVSDRSHYALLWQAIRSETGAAFLKVEAGHFQDQPAPDFAAMGFAPSPQSIQPNNTVQIDIRDDEEIILKGMNQGTRRKVRKSLRAGLNYIRGSREDLEDFNRLMQLTSERNEFGVHSPEYYERVFDLFIPEHGALLLAKYQNRSLGAIMIFALGSTAWYFYGASSRENSNLYASYGLQWEAIQWAKARGCLCYDMWGIPDHDHETLESQFQERSDGLWGVYGFKRGWGGQICRATGSWDLAFNPFVYSAYRTALKFSG